ncbi:MAG: (d)CMP kinase [Peptococcaceae bacterium]|nr:(d)CMP kinase [Peptococcaceae bacterium]
MQIAIDGPAGVGKSTLAKALASHYGMIYLDTGAMYRGVALLASREGIAPEEGAAMDALLGAMDLNFREHDGKKSLYNHDEDLETAIRQPEIAKIVSAYASLGSVRQAMTAQQQRIAAKNDVVMDGRDIGTVVLPHADYKFFISASVQERARRRYLELEEKGIAQNFDELVKDLAERDRKDQTRAIAPLKKAEDAILIDTDHLDAQGVLEKIIEIISK